MAYDLSITVLLTDGFGGFGGISKFNRDFLRALDAAAQVEQVKVLPRLIPEPIEEPLPEKVVYDRAAAAGKVAYLRRVAAQAIHRPPCDLVVCGHINLLGAAWSLSRRHGAKLALVIHGIDAWTPTRSPLVNRLAASIDSLVAVSRYSADRFCAWSGVAQDKAFILPNSVDTRRFKPAPKDPGLIKRYGLEGRRVIVTVGRLAETEAYKGFDEIIEALPSLAQRFPDVAYLVVGGGGDRARLEAKAGALGVSDRVVFTGQIPEAEKVAHFNLGDVYAMPSRGEGFGIVLLEAAACGLPVVGSNADGSREALQGGRLGRLVDPRSQPELIAAISDVLANPPSLRAAPPSIEEFSEASFRRRVEAWVDQLSAPHLQGGSLAAAQLDRIETP